MEKELASLLRQLNNVVLYITLSTINYVRTFLGLLTTIVHQQMDKITIQWMWTQNGGSLNLDIYGTPIIGFQAFSFYFPHPRRRERLKAAMPVIPIKDATNIIWSYATMLKIYMIKSIILRSNWSHAVYWKWNRGLFNLITKKQNTEEELEFKLQRYKL